MTHARDVKLIATHDGSPHYDDWMSVALWLMLYPNAKVIRTRDPAKIAAADVALDVGEVCEAATGRRDHHGRAKAGNHANGTKRATLGLTWDDIGVEICRLVVPECEFPHEGLAQEAFEQMVLQGDGLDNGQLEVTGRLLDHREVEIPVTTVSGLMELLRPALLVEDTSNEAMDACFFAHIPFLQLVARKYVLQALSMLRGMELVRPAEVRSEGRIVILPQDCEWERAVARLFPHALYVVHPTPKNWRCRAVATQPGGFISKKPLPQEWISQSGEALTALTGVSDVVFVHNGRFLAGVGSKDGAIALAAKAVEAG